MSDLRRDHRLVPVPSEIRERVTALVRQRGPAAASRVLGISRHAVVAVAAGLDVMPGTLSLLREAIRREAA